MSEIEISKIIPNPINIQIYGESDNSLQDDIKENGILEPLVINQDFRIISGHRRYNGAKSAGLKVVPYVMINTTSEN